MQGWVFVFRQDGVPGSSNTRHRRLISWSERYSISFIQHCGRRIHRILTQSTIYSICSVLQKKVYPSRIANVAELKTRLIDEWEHFHQSTVDAAIAEWRHRLCSACVRVSGAHFEHKLKQA